MSQIDQKHASYLLGVRSVLIACALNAVVGALFFHAARVEPNFSVTTAVFIRIVSNFLLLLLLMPARGFPAVLGWGSNRPIWLWGLAGFFVTACFFSAIPLVGAGTTSFLNAGSGIFIAALAPILAAQRTSVAQWVCVVGSFLGVTLISLNRSDFSNPFGMALAVISGMASAFAYVMIARTRERYRPESILLHWAIPNFLLFVMIVLVQRPPWPSTLVGWALVLAIGLLAATAQYLMVRAYQTAPAALIGCLTYLSPAASVAVDVLLFKLSFSLISLAGILLVLFFGAYLPFRSFRKPDNAVILTEPSR